LAIGPVPVERLARTSSGQQVRMIGISIRR